MCGDRTAIIVGSRVNGVNTGEFRIAMARESNLEGTWWCVKVRTFLKVDEDSALENMIHLVRAF